MQLVEQHIIDKSDSRFARIDATSFLSKNLYNAANYAIRQRFFGTGKYTSYVDLARSMVSNPDFVALPRKVSQQVMMQLDRDWRSFFEAIKSYRNDASRFLGRPKLPDYKHKTAGRGVLTYTSQAISKTALDRGFIKPSGLDIQVRTRQNPADICQVRIVPHKTHYTVEVIYEKQPQPAENLNPEWHAGLDIGLDNLAAIASNKPGFVPVVVNGRHLKSINQFFNKRKADLQSRLPVGVSSAKLDRLHDKRNRKIKHELHVASRHIVDHLVAKDIGNLVIGKNEKWKQSINLGRKTNQNFVSIPHARFIDMLTYKAELVGIKVTVTEESYTSKCSFLDMEPLEHRDKYLGRRRFRGLFISASGRTIHADVQGSYNMIRKVVPDAFAEGIEGVVVHPVRFERTKREVELLSITS